MNVLSLFDGMSCGQIALERAGIKVDNYYASEIDPYAIKITMKNYPKTIQLGSITDWRTWDIPKPDLIIGGSPCQGFSFAGKGLNFDDPRSKLFLEFHDILKHYKPKQFLLENVIMSAQSNDVISSMLGDLYPECVGQKQLFKTGRLEPIMINSALVSAQFRERLYWTDIKDITQPIDKGIYLRDIVEKNVTTRGISDKLCKYIINKKGEPSHNLDRKSKVFTAGAHSGGSHSDMDLIPMRMKSKTLRSGEFTSKPEDRQEWNNIPFRCKQVGEADISGNEYTRRVYSPDGKMRCLNAGGGGNLEPKISEDNITWRKLTVTECERLQTVPDGYTEGVSNTRRYHALGNGWTVDVIKHIFSFLPKEYKYAL